MWKKRQWSSTVACLFPFVFKSCSRCHYYINFLLALLFPHLPAHHNYNTPSSSNCFWLHLINLLFHKFLPWSPLVEYLQNLCWFFLFNWPNISLWLAIKQVHPNYSLTTEAQNPCSTPAQAVVPLSILVALAPGLLLQTETKAENNIILLCPLLAFWWQIDESQTVLKTFFNKCDVLGWYL